MNDESVQVLAKHINTVDATFRGNVDQGAALNAILGLIIGYVPGNVNINEESQRYILERVKQILDNCRKY